MPYTTTKLLADVRRSGMLPNTATVGTSDTDILAHADKEIQCRIVPLVMSVREEFCVRSKDTALVSGQSAYRIPSRAIGAKLRDVLLAFSDGTTRNLARLSPEEAQNYSPTSSPYPAGFYLEQNSVVLVPTPNSSGAASLRLKYFVRPNALVATGYTIGSIDTALSKVLVTNGSGIFSTFSTVDIISAKSPFDSLAIDQTPTAANISGADVYLTFASLPDGLALGDYVADAEQSAVPQVPLEFHNYLYQRTLCRVLQSIGDTEGLAAAERDAEKMREDALTLLANRVEGEPKKVVPSLLYNRRRSWRLF